MARPTTIDDEVILEAARQVFLEEGYAATTASIARRAGVSPGSLFKRFTSKEELFWRAMDLSGTDDIEWIQHLPGMVGTGSVQQNIAHILTEMLLELRHAMPHIMMAWSNLPPEFIATKFDKTDHPAEVISKHVRNYLHAEIALGRLREFDVDQFTQVLMGHAFYTVFMRMTTDSHRQSAPSTPETHAEVAAMAERFVAVLWQGLAPTQD